MQPSAAARTLLVAFEGIKLRPYDDVAGYQTIGVGHRIMPGERLAALTPDEAMDLLDRDLKRIGGSVSKVLDGFTVSQGEFDALVCFAFNEGPLALAASTLLELLKAGDRAGAAEQFLEWNKAHVNGRLVELEGLDRRRHAERAMFLGEGLLRQIAAKIPAG